MVSDEQVAAFCKAFHEAPEFATFKEKVLDALEVAEAAALRPIEEAPKDGTPFHGLVGEDLIKMFWHDEFGEFVSSFRRMQMRPGYLINGKEYEDHSPIIHKPKYFRPLPEPPR